VKAPWHDHFYIARHDEKYVYLWYIKERGTKKKLKGGFVSRSGATVYLEKNWEIMLNERIEDTLLGVAEKV